MALLQGQPKNKVQDAGDFWRAVGVDTIQHTTKVPHKDTSGRDTGIYYYVGPDPVSGRTRIAYIDYPKSQYSHDEVENSSDTEQLLIRCNVCSAIDHIAASRGINLVAPTPASSAPSQRVVYPDQVNLPVQAQTPVPRISLGVAVHPQALPKWLPFLFNLGKGMVFSGLGGAVASVGASVGADLLSGLFEDPSYRQALQCASDEFIEGVPCDEASQQQYKQDMVEFLTAYQKDSDLIGAAKKALLKSPAELTQEIKESGVEVRVDRSTSVSLGRKNPPRSFIG